MLCLVGLLEEAPNENVIIVASQLLPSFTCNKSEAAATNNTSLHREIRKMAEVAVTVLLPKLKGLLEREVHLLGGVQDDICTLRDRLQWLHLFLGEADQKCDRNKFVKLWVTQIREATYEAENIIDKYLLKKQRHPARAGFLHLMGRPFRMPRRWMALHEIGQKIKSINTKLDRISANRSEYGIPKDPEARGSSSSTDRDRRGRRLIIAKQHDGDAVGNEDDTKAITKHLIEGESRRAVVSIIGMGGLGKTTLAQKVCNCDDVKRHFQCFAWTYVSQEFSVQDLLCNIIKSVTGIDKEELKKNEEDLRTQLSECLRGKVYLVVLDDIWNIEAWNGLATSFPDEANGSRILLTTRNKDLALRVDPLGTTHEPRSLTVEECWELLCKKAFPRDHDCPHHLVKIGEKIAKKCHGLPLAVVVLGGLLSTKSPTIHEWTKVSESIIWHLNESEKDEISSILGLSYYDLPNHLKPCFLHFASFPEDFAIPAPTLIQTWVAEGFIEERGLETMEDIAEDYLLELVNRSMIQVAKWGSSSRVEECRIHGLLREVAVRKAKENMFLDAYANTGLPTAARRLAVTHDDISKCMSINHSQRYLRSLYCFSRIEVGLQKAEWKTMCATFTLLRVMHLTSLRDSRIPVEIGDLIHLRYLVLEFHDSSREVLTIPSNFSKLYNLQTFMVESPLREIYINVDIWKLKNLRHLELYPLAHFQKTIQCLQLNKLTSLQTLKSMLAGDWIKDDLSKLTSLRELGINGDVASYQATLFESIGKLENLRHFGLIFNEGITFVPFHLSHLVHLETLYLSGHMDVLPPFRDFPANLTVLHLKDSNLRQDPMAILEKLPELERLSFSGLNSYVGKKMSCSAEGFPKLKSLAIQQMQHLEEWIVEDGAMPNLKELTIRCCNNLKMVPEGFRHLTNLQKLVLYGMPFDFCARMRENGEDWDKIKHIPSISINRFRGDYTRGFYELAAISRHHHPFNNQERI